MPAPLIHGHTAKGIGPHRRTSEYVTWRSMKSRCGNPSKPEYLNVTICPEWRDSFMAFLRDMGPKPSHLHTIDRIDNAKGYEPGNCRWATPAEQAVNRTSNRFNGESVAQAAAGAGLTAACVRNRIRRGTPKELWLAPVGALKAGHDGTSGRGEKNAHAKLTEAEVRQIRASDDRVLDLAARYGVSKTTINLIRTRKIWKHVK